MPIRFFPNQRLNNNNPWASSIRQVEAKMAQAAANANKAEAALAANPGDVKAQQALESAQNYYYALQQEQQLYIANYAEVESTTTVSTGGVVLEANKANDNNANAQRPANPQQVLNPNGRIQAEETKPGTNANPSKTTANNPTTDTANTPVNTNPQNQAVNTGGGQSTTAFARTDPRRLDKNTARPNSNTTPVANLGPPGAAAPRDDNTQPTPNVLINKLNTLYAADYNFIKDQPNVLDNYPSYTYSLSWYLLAPWAWSRLVQDVKGNTTNFDGYYLLARTGGIPDTKNIPGGRNRFFGLDYYIDNLIIETGYGSSLDTGGPMEFLNLSFTVTEPNGLSLPKNLYQAVAALYDKLKDPLVKANYAAGMYCMVIRFYGYDENGNPVMPIKAVPGSKNSNLIVEKFCFFQLANFEYSMTSRAIEYKITGAAPATAVGFSVNRGSIPVEAQFTGTTVKDVLVGQLQQVSASVAAGDQTRNGNPIKPAPAQPPFILPEAESAPIFSQGGL